MSSSPRRAPYYNVAELRVDLWNDLRNYVEALRDGVGESEESLLTTTKATFADLAVIEQYYSFPGLERLHALSRALDRGEHAAVARRVDDLNRLLVSEAYRSRADDDQDDEVAAGTEHRSMQSTHSRGESRPRFDVLFVDDLAPDAEADLKTRMREMRSSSDSHLFDLVVTRSVQDALIALFFNYSVQAIVVRYAPPRSSGEIPSLLRPYVGNVLKLDLQRYAEADLGPALGRLVRRFRPEVDIYYVTDTALSELKDSTLQLFRRIFYRREDLQELHLAILRGVRERAATPFFTALKEYSQLPTGVFHAMPISRGNSVFRSQWIRDFAEFYGRNTFLAETSATTGGLDSLLQPTGTLKKAQEMAAQAYGAKRTFFVTNGTSTANKIVLQALVQPGDVVLVDRDCHKSHHYGLMLSGAYPVYLDSYPIREYSMYGAVPLEHILDKLRQLEAAGRLDRVRMLLLTNCTFDGLVYNVEQVMEQVLAIKPDMIFLWDEAWFAFAGFSFTFRQRTGMYVAAKLAKRYRSEEYREEYEKHIASLKKGERSRLPDPDSVRIRVYSTQSTHKTLTSFRQGSMIHVWDEDFRKKTEPVFQEAYMTHTSTSPNYQILGSLDVGRRQVQFEGYELVEKSVEMAMVLRAKITDNPLLRKYFTILTTENLIPQSYRPSGLSEFYRSDHGWSRLEEAWETDEFVLDPTKVTLAVGLSGVDGDTFKNRHLMERYNIQINKTSRNTVLLMTNIGTTRGSVAYLVNALLRIAGALDEERHALSPRELELLEKKVHSLTNAVPALPDFSHFHASFQAVPGVPGGNIREAYFLAARAEACDYVPLAECLRRVESGGELVSAAFVIPYPPGFPVLVPGQVLSADIAAYLLALDVKEIHGYRGDLGLKVFCADVLEGRERTPETRSIEDVISSRKVSHEEA